MVGDVDDVVAAGSLIMSELGATLFEFGDVCSSEAAFSFSSSSRRLPKLFWYVDWWSEELSSVPINITGLRDRGVIIDS